MILREMEQGKVKTNDSKTTVNNYDHSKFIRKYESMYKQENSVQMSKKLITCTHNTADKLDIGLKMLLKASNICW